MSPERKFYVYAHYRKSDGAMFYVGKGSGKRYTNDSGRNKYWRRIADKHGWSARIISQDMPEACALSLEMALIASRKEALSNITLGGEGVTGLKHSKEARRKMSANRSSNSKSFWKGKTMPFCMKYKFRLAKLGKEQSPEHAQKSRTAKLGKPQPKSAREATRRIKSRPVLASNGEWFSSASEASRVLSKRLGVRCSQGNISMAATGLRNQAYSLKWRYIT